MAVRSEAEGNQVRGLSTEREAHIRVEPLHAHAKLGVHKLMRPQRLLCTLINMVGEIVVDFVRNLVVDFSDDRTVSLANDVTVLRGKFLCAGREACLRGGQTQEKTRRGLG